MSPGAQVRAGADGSISVLGGATILCAGSLNFVSFCLDHDTLQQPQFSMRRAVPPHGQRPRGPSATSRFPRCAPSRCDSVTRGSSLTRTTLPSGIETKGKDQHA
jgi:hypothetical protein